MQPRKNRNGKILRVLAMAATAAMAPKVAKGVSLSAYYGQDTSYANSNNGVFISTQYAPSNSAIDSQGELQTLGGTVSPVTVSQTAATTISLPIGDYLSFSIDTVLTGNVNAQAGAFKLGDAGPQPSYLGLATLGVIVQSSDTTGIKLIPLPNQPFQLTTINGVPAYGSSTEINTRLGPNGGAAANAYSAAPAWQSVVGGGDVEPNLPGYNTAPNSSGGIGTQAGSTNAGAFPTGGNVGGTAGVVNGDTLNTLTQFASSTNQASYAAATDFADQLGFYGAAPGVVTLTPSVVAGSTQYWTFSSIVNGTHEYRATNFGPADSIGSLPVLVVDVGAAVPEPMTLGLITLGGAFMLTRRRHRSVKR